MNQANPEQVDDPLLVDAIYLIETARARGEGRVTFYDEVDSSIHTYEHGVLEIGTDYVDYRSYGLELEGEQLYATLRIPEKGQAQEFALDDEDWEDLTERVMRMADQVRTYERVQTTDVGPLWTQLLEALARHDPVKAMVDPEPEFRKKDLAGSVHALLERMGRLDRWEWKEFGEVGVHAVMSLLAARGEGHIEVPYATPQESRRVFDSDDSSGAVLASFDRHLRPHGWTLAAIAPFDELQAFALIRAENASEVRVLLRELGVQTEWAPSLSGADDE